MSDIGAPQCWIEVFPHEGGAYAITSGQVLTCDTEKQIKAGAGRFTITLAPGGPNGPNVGPSWLDIITPMSFVMIGMARGTYRGIVMLGVVTNMREQWMFPNGPVQRAVVVTGFDIGYFFTHFSWYALTYLNGPAAALSGGGTGAALATDAGLGGYLSKGSPDTLGNQWYSNIMAGDNGILSSTWFEYGQNNSVLFNKAVTVKFEKFVDNIVIPFSFAFMAEETWWVKFNKIFPYPWYEFFVMTAPDGFYDKALSTSWTDVAQGMTFTMTGLGSNVKARIYVIARVNPLPQLQATGTDSGITFGDVKSDAWGGLTQFPEVSSLIATTEEFSEDEVRNFYIVNPTFMRSMQGQSNSAVTPPLLAGCCAVDPASIHRYGYRPIYMETEWFSDQEGTTAASSDKVDFAKVMGDLVGMFASQYEPLPLMMRAERRGSLRPDIIAGNRFTYQPLKDKIASPWSFYIEGVAHHWRFGGPSTTSLSLSRGLPQTVYSDSGLLTAIFKGNAQRVNGQYQQGLPQGPKGAETGLTGASLLSADNQKVLSAIAPIFTTPQSDQVGAPSP